MEHPTMPDRPLGVISALPEELAHFSDQWEDRGLVGGFHFRGGQIADRKAFFVECGPGKVNAGVATALLLERFRCGALLLCGVAGGVDPKLSIGDVVVGLSNTQHDFGIARETGFETIRAGNPPSQGQAGPPSFVLADQVVLRLREALTGFSLDQLPEEFHVGRRSPSIHFGHIVTGDSYVSHEALRERLRTQFQACAVEMEGGAVAQIARRWSEDIPLVNVRCLSDLAGHDSNLDFRTFLPVASRYASLVAHRLAPVI